MILSASNSFRRLPVVSGRRLAAALLGMLALAILAPTAPAGAATPLYPDLRMPSPTDLHLTLWPVASGAEHYQLRFETKPSNYGRGALEVDRVPTPSGIADLTQRIYEEPAGFRDEVLGSVVFAPLDTLFPVPDLARYELWTHRHFVRAQKRNFRRGQPLHVTDNIGHCIRDDEPIDPDTPHVEGESGTYHFCTKLVSGISAGWRSTQSWGDDGQYIDFGLTPLPDGDYVLRAIVDPYNLLWESDGKGDPAREGEVANSGVTYFRVIDGALVGMEEL